jgi:hypothetical protein
MDFGCLILIEASTAHGYLPLTHYIKFIVFDAFRMDGDHVDKLDPDGYGQGASFEAGLSTGVCDLTMPIG